MLGELSEFFEEDNKKPTNLESVYYIFWDKGISQVEFELLDLPYIFNIIKVFKYTKTEEAKAMQRRK